MQTLKFLSVLSIIFLMNPPECAQEDALDLKQLIGKWKLDMTPENKEDSNFSMMTIDGIDINKIEGEFYREGVIIEEGRTNTQLGIIYVALVSRDNSGSYNTTFYLKDGKLYGSTHSIKKDFLSVWIATKDK